MDQKPRTRRPLTKEAWVSHTREGYKRLGNLDDGEIEELLRLKTSLESESVEDKVRTIYLEIKAKNPSSAEQFLETINPLVARGLNSEDDVKVLCATIQHFWKGVLIQYNGHSYGFNEQNIFFKDGEEWEK